MMKMLRGGGKKRGSTHARFHEIFGGVEEAERGAGWGVGGVGGKGRHGFI